MPQTNGKSKMTVEKFALEKLGREEWRVRLEKLAKENPLVLHTNAGRTFSTVRRMKAEKKDGHSYKPALWFRYLHKKRKGGERDE